MASIDFATTVLLIKGNEAEPAFRLLHNNSFRISDDDNDDETSDDHNINIPRATEAVPQVRRLRFHSSLIETPLVARGEHTRSQYILQEEIRKGAFATVFKAFDPSTNRVYTAKKHSYEYSPAEINILRRVSHDHIVAFVDTLDRLDTILVLEYIAGGNFSQLASPTEDEVTITLNQQLLAVGYLHSIGITHRDIKPANILIQQRRPDLITKLSDFGLSSETARLVTFCGTKIYCAPEIEESYRQKSKPQGKSASYTNAVDVWSLGILGLEYTIGLPRQPKPWHHSRWTQRIISRVSDHQGPLRSLLTEMLQFDPKRRPSADECLLRFQLQSHGIPTTQVTKRGVYHLSSIQEDPMAKIPSSNQERKRARLEQSESDIQPEHQVLDLFRSQYLRNSLCVGSVLATQTQEDETELDLSESTSHSEKTGVQRDSRVTVETTVVARGVGSERDLSKPACEDSWDQEREEIARQLLSSIQKADEKVDKTLHENTTSESPQFRSSGVC